MNTFTSEQKQTLVHAINHFGVDHQIDKAVEEMGELIVALSRRLERSTQMEIAEEIADVLIVVNQLRIIYGGAEVDEIIAQKLDRLERKMDGDWRRVMLHHPLIRTRSESKPIDNTEQN